LSWLRYMTERDVAQARRLKNRHDLPELRHLVTESYRADWLFSNMLIPASCLASLAAVMILLWSGSGQPADITRGFLAIGAMLIPYPVIIMGFRSLRRGRIVALAYHLREREGLLRKLGGRHRTDDDHSTA